MARYFEDFAAGQVERFGTYHVTREEVIAFASKYDPQPFHLDDDAAAATHFGRIAASGWHTGAMAMRMLVDHWQGVGLQSLGSPGMESLRWLKPVYPGDTLSVGSEVLETRTSRSRPEMGMARVRTSVFNQNEDLVMDFLGTQMLRRRPVTA